MKILPEIVELLKSNKVKIIACSEWDVQRFEEALQIRLPHVYREFLKAMGGGAGDFMKGSECFYDDLLTISRQAAELLEENHFRPLPPNSFVFFMHQGYMFAFFELDKEDDPPVYMFSEGSDEDNFLLLDDSFSSFLNRHLNDIVPDNIKN